MENKMTLEQLAKEAMDYLDSVGVAAEYWISNDEYLYVETDDRYGVHIAWSFDDHDAFMDEIKAQYPKEEK